MLASSEPTTRTRSATGAVVAVAGATAAGADGAGTTAAWGVGGANTPDAGAAPAGTAVAGIIVDAPVGGNGTVRGESAAPSRPAALCTWR